MKKLNPFRGIPVRAGRSLETIPARPWHGFLSVTRRLSGAYLRFVVGVRLTNIEGRDELDRAISSEQRYPFIVFRHPSPDDPIVMYHTVSDALRRAGRPIQRGGYPVFLYGRDVPIWGGPLVAWALPRGGAIAIYHDAINRESMEELYEAIGGQTNPMVLAPEGQISYRNYVSSWIQRGAAALAFDAADIRSSEGSQTPVLVLPAVLEYRYPDTHWRRAAQVMERILLRLGIDAKMRPRRGGLARALAAHPDRWLLTAWKEYANQLCAIHRREVPPLYGELSAVHKAETPPQDNQARTALETLCKTGMVPNDPEHLPTLQRTIDLLLDLSLRRAEIGFQLTPLREPLDRIFRIRQRYWERLYPFDRGTPGSMARAVADSSATEARLLSRHMQSADVLVYAELSYLTPILDTPLNPGSPGHARFVEFLLMLDDLLQRAIGATVGQRFVWPGRTCCVQFGDPIDVTPAAPDGPSRRKRIAELHHQIGQTLSSLSSERSARDSL